MSSCQISKRTVEEEPFGMIQASCLEEKPRFAEHWLMALFPTSDMDYVFRAPEDSLVNDRAENPAKGISPQITFCFLVTPQKWNLLHLVIEAN